MSFGIERCPRRHRLISISYISSLPCHGSVRECDSAVPRHFFSNCFAFEAWPYRDCPIAPRISKRTNLTRQGCFKVSSTETLKPLTSDLLHAPTVACVVVADENCSSVPPVREISSPGDGPGRGPDEDLRDTAAYRTFTQQFVDLPKPYMAKTHSQCAACT